MLSPLPGLQRTGVGRLYCMLVLLEALCQQFAAHPENAGYAGNAVTVAKMALAMRLALLPSLLPHLVAAVTAVRLGQDCFDFGY
jgi:hypothetical protein